MTFSNVNVFRSSVLNLKSSDPGATADKIIRGGAFSPNTQEAIAIMRSDVDNQWENSYIIKYQALMQNRLNRLRQDLTNAYKAILEQSAVQQVRENGANAANSALTDVYGRMLPNSNEAFKSLTYYNNEDEFTAADGGGQPNDLNNVSAADGVPSYLLQTGLKQYGAAETGKNGEEGVVEMRKLYVTGPALQVVNTMKIAFRTEEVPTEFTKVGIGPIPIPLGDKPLTPGQKVAEYSTDVKAGGFFTTVNYLYNFAPRELKYSYPTAYSTNTEETGTRQVTVGAGKKGQAVLFNNQLTDARDVYSINPSAGGLSGGYTEDSPIPQYTFKDGEKPPIGSRVKWNNSNASDGYITERSPVFTQRDNGGGELDDADDDRLITRRQSDNDSKFKLDTYNSFGETIKGNLANPWIYDSTTGKKVIFYGSEETLGGDGSMADRIKWEYSHDGKGTIDANQDGTADDDHLAKSAFINHYTVQTQTVELNSSANSYGTVKAVAYDGIKTSGVDQINNQLVLRSTGIDGSADHVFNKVVDPSDKEKLLLSGSGKIAKNFDGSYVSSLYNLKSFNGQDIATESANINITSRNDKDKVVIAEYEGFKRAETMNRGIADDIFSTINYDPSAPRSLEDAKILARKLETEINASKMVDTDWHYSEYSTAANKGVMFKHIAEIPYESPTGADSIKVNYRADMIEGGVGGNFKDITVGFRKTFTLEPRDFQKAVYSGSTNSDIYINTPTYENKDVFVSTVTTNATEPADLIVNGRVVPPISTGTGNPRTITYNLKGFLNAGDNVIASQVKFDINDTGTNKDSFELIPTAAAGNETGIENWIKGKISTVQANNGDNKLDKLTQSNLSKNLSSWQSKIMVEKITPNFFNANFPYRDTNPPYSPTNPLTVEPGSPPGFNSFKAYDEYINALSTLGSVNTATRVKDNNSFSRILTEALNKPEYQDIFNLGLLNTDLGKTMTIKAQVSAPTGGSVNATMDIQYDPINNKFILVQNKFDAFGGA